MNLAVLETDGFFVIELFPLLVSFTSPASVLILFHCCLKSRKMSHSTGGLHGVEFKVYFIENLQEIHFLK